MPESQAQIRTQIKPKLPVTKIETVYVSKRTYNVIRSIAESSIDSIKCYELQERWWCEKRTFGKLKWAVEPSVVQKGDEEIPAVSVVNAPITVVHPGHRHRLYAISIEGRDYPEDALDRIAVMPNRNVPYATPVLLRDVVEKIDEIVDW